MQLMFSVGKSPSGGVAGKPFYDKWNPPPPPPLGLLTAPVDSNVSVGIHHAPSLQLFSMLDDQH